MEMTFGSPSTINSNVSSFLPTNKNSELNSTKFEKHSSGSAKQIFKVETPQRNSTLFNFNHPNFFPIPITSNFFDSFVDLIEEEEVKLLESLEKQKKPPKERKKRVSLSIDSFQVDSSSSFEDGGEWTIVKKKERIKKKEAKSETEEETQSSLKEEEEEKEKLAMNLEKTKIEEAIEYKPPNHIIFQSWFVQCLFEQVPMFVWGILVRVCKAWKKYGQELLTRATQVISHLNKNNNISIKLLFAVLSDIKNRAPRGWNSNPETLQLRIPLRDYSTQFHKKFVFRVVVPHKIKENVKFLIFGDEYSELPILYSNIQVLPYAQIYQIGRNKKYWKKIAKSVDFILALPHFIRSIPRIVGPSLNKYRKFPHLIVGDIMDTIHRLERTVYFILKKVPILELVIGSTALTILQIAENFQATLAAVVETTQYFRKGWHNIGKIYLKSTSSPCYCLYKASKITPQLPPKYPTSWTYSKDSVFPKLKISFFYYQLKRKSRVLPKKQKGKGVKKFLARLAIKKKKDLF